MNSAAGSGLTIHAVVRNRRSERALDLMQGLGDAFAYRLVDSGGLAAVVTDACVGAPGTETGDDARAALRRHGRLVARMLRRSSIVPAPLGLVAEDEAAVRAFLERQARAARILSEGGGESILSVAFLLSRNEWIRFVEQVVDWESRYPGVRMDVTGPWAAWDFVHVMAAGDLASTREVQ